MNKGETPLLNLIKKYKPKELTDRVPEDGMARIATILYQLGGFAKCVLRCKENSDVKGYTGELALSLADMVLQLRLACEYYGLDWEKVCSLSEEHFEERLKEYREFYNNTGQWR